MTRCATMERWLWALVLAGAASLLGACDKQKVEVFRLRPAPFFLAEHRTLAVATLDGTNGEELATMLQTELDKMERHRLIDRTSVRAEQASSALGGASESNMASLARLLGADATVYGTIREKPREHHELMEMSAPRRETLSNGSSYYVPGRYVWTRTTSMTLEVTLQAVDRHNNPVGATTFQAHSRAHQETSQWRSFSPVSWEPHRREAFQALPAAFASQLSPATESVLVTLYSTKKLPESKSAIEAMQRGDWAHAISLYRQSVAHSGHLSGKYRSRAYYNLGIALALAGHTDEAITQLRIAHELQPSKKLAEIIVDASDYGQRVAEARRQLAILGNRLPPQDIPTEYGDEPTPVIEPWEDENEA